MKKNLIKLVEVLKADLQEEILMRYDNSEYWNYDIVNSFCQDNKLNVDEVVDKLLKI